MIFNVNWVLEQHVWLSDLDDYPWMAFWNYVSNIAFTIDGQNDKIHGTTEILYAGIHNEQIHPAITTTSAIVPRCI